MFMSSILSQKKKARIGEEENTSIYEAGQECVLFPGIKSRRMERKIMSALPHENQLQVRTAQYTRKSTIPLTLIVILIKKNRGI